VSVVDVPDLLAQVGWDERGLVCAVAQEAGSGRVLMLAWMNREALTETLRTGYATYWSRSRGRLWRKGEESGHRQRVSVIQLDCDGDALLLQVQQDGGMACHTGRHSCFFRTLGKSGWVDSEAVLRDPAEIYGAAGPGGAGSS
jgi:phosphoribosyl-AMP cyclohydrolase